MLMEAYFYYKVITKEKKKSNNCEVQKNFQNFKAHRRQLLEQAGIKP